MIFLTINGIAVSAMPFLEYFYQIELHKSQFIANTNHKITYTANIYLKIELTESDLSVII